MDERDELAALRRMAELEARAGNKVEEPGSLGGFLAESGKTLARGGIGGILSGLEAMSAGTLDPATMKPVQNPLIAKGWAMLDKAIPKQDGIYNEGIEAAGAGLTGGGPRAVLPSAAGGMTTEGAKGFLDKVLPPEMASKVSAGLGMLVGAGAGYGLGPKQNAAQDTLRGSLEGTTPADWAQAGRNVQDFQQSGARTATLADALSNRQRLVGVAKGVDQNPGGELFSSRMAGRDEDLNRLGVEFLNRVNPAVSVNQVANRTSDSANSVLENARNLRSEAYRNALDGVNVSTRDITGVHQNLLRMARNPQNTDEVRQAYQEVANRMLRNGGRSYITNLQDLGLNLKALKRNPPAIDAASGAKVDAETLRRAIVDAEAYIGQVSPRYQLANEEFSDFSQRFVRPLREGPVGKMADKNPNLPDPTPAGRLDQLMGKDNGPADIATALFNLRDPSQTRGPVPSAEIARAVYQRKLDMGSTDPGKTVRGDATSPANERLERVIQASGGDPATVTQPLRAADAMQALRGPVGANQAEAPRSLLGALLTPFRRGEFVLTKGAKERYNRELAELLTNNTPEGLARLREIAMFDPQVRRMLTARSAIAPVMANSEENQ